MNDALDVLVIGGGPAGMAAATAAARAGARTRLIDEAMLPGGQVYRAPLPGMSLRDGGSDPDLAAGNRLRAALHDSGAAISLDHGVWSVAPGFHIDALGPDGLRRWSAPNLVVAAGTTERVVPFPGWTTPGVFGLAAATIMLKAQKILPGRRVAVAGVGPLVYAVATKLLASGGEVAAVVDLAGMGDWLARLPTLAARPDLLARGAAWMVELRRRGVPVFHRATIAAVSGQPRCRAIEIRPVDSARRPIAGAATTHIACDALVVGHGLVPQTEIGRMLGAEHHYDRVRGGWIPRRDADFATSVPGLFVAGDGGGISGAAAAELQGEIAGLAAARRAGVLGERDHARLSEAVRPWLARAERFGGAMAEMMALHDGQLDGVAPDTIVCRCEDITRAEIEAAVTDGASDANQMKAWTRCGMGPCQGRTCGDIAQAIVAHRVGGRDAARPFTARPPLRPLPTARLIGAFDYADIPIPKPAPL